MNIGSVKVKKPMAGVDRLTVEIKLGIQGKIRRIVGTKLMILGGKVLGAKDVKITTS